MVLLFAFVFNVFACYDLNTTFVSFMNTINTGNFRIVEEAVCE